MDPKEQTIGNASSDDVKLLETSARSAILRQETRPNTSINGLIRKTTYHAEMLLLKKAACIAITVRSVTAINGLLPGEIRGW